MSDDGLDLEAQLSLLASRMITEAMNEPAVVANWILVVDVRNQNQESHIGCLQPGGMPDWIRDAMLREVGSAGLGDGFFEAGDEDDDEGSEDE